MCLYIYPWVSRSVMEEKINGDRESKWTQTEHLCPFVVCSNLRSVDFVQDRFKFLLEGAERLCTIDQFGLCFSINHVGD